MSDLRYALRQLGKHPGVAILAVLTLGVGIGATTTVFSVVDTLMLRALPYPEADRIVTVWQNNTREGVPRDDVSPANFHDWRERHRVFREIAAAEPFSLALQSDGRPQEVPTSLVTLGFFDVLGVKPRLGRGFLPEEHEPGQGDVVLLSDRLWRQRFGTDPSVVGRKLVLDGRPHVVVGVLPPGLELGMPQVDERGFWAPHAVDAHRDTRGSAWWNVIARLRTGVSLQQAQQDMDRIARELAAEYPATNTGIGATVTTLREQLVGTARPALLMLLGAVVLVLLIACVNVANLLLARGAEREDEFAVRAALGASRARLVRQMWAESAAVGLAGGVLGAALAFWGVDAVKRLAPGDIARIDAVVVDLRILAFALGLSVLTAFLSGGIPALRLSRPMPRIALGAVRGTAGVMRQRLRGALVVAEVALALTLVVGAGLLLRSFVTLLRVDPGFRSEDVVALQVFAWDGRPSAAERVAFFAETLDRIEAAPGAVSAGAVSAGPFLEADITIRRSFVKDDGPAPPPGSEPITFVTHATPGYFRTVGIPLLAGRGLTEADRAGARRVALINRTARRWYWPAQDPIGRRIRLDRDSTWVEIVGVVGDVRHTGLDVEPRPEVFLPQAQTGFASMTYFVRAQGAAGAALEAAQRAVWSVDPNLAFYHTASVRQLIARTLAARRFSLVLLTAFSVIALVLAAIGLYGVVSFSVSRRTREFGIRIAVGAERGDIVDLVVRQGLTLTLTGVALGLALALAASEVLASLLYHVAPRDLPTFAAAAAFLTAVSALACYLPARRATRVDPMEALRYE